MSYHYFGPTTSSREIEEAGKIGSIGYLCLSGSATLKLENF